MSWKSWVQAQLTAATQTLGDSIAYLKRKTGLTITDRQADALAAKAQKAIADIEAILAGVIDEIPGVPSIVAKIGAHAAAQVLDAAIAGAAEAVKANN